MGIDITGDRHRSGSLSWFIEEGPKQMVAELLLISSRIYSGYLKNVKEGQKLYGLRMQLSGSKIIAAMPVQIAGSTG